MSKTRQITLTEKRFFEWHEDDVSVTLRNKGGSYGGGVRGDYCTVYCVDTVGALQYDDYKGPNRQYVESGKLIVMGVAMQDVTGTLNPGAHAGSYNGQDAYNDLLVVSDESSMCRQRTTGQHINGGGRQYVRHDA